MKLFKYEHNLFFLSYIAPNGPPINVTVIVLNSLTANISWAPPLYLDRNGIISSYSVEISHRLGKYYDTTKSTFFRATGQTPLGEVALKNRNFVFTRRIIYKHVMVHVMVHVVENITTTSCMYTYTCNY